MNEGEEGIVSIANTGGSKKPQGGAQLGKPKPAAGLGIRTMRDDLVQARSAGTSGAAKSGAPSGGFRAPIKPPSLPQESLTKSDTQSIRPLAGKTDAPTLPPSGKELLESPTSTPKKKGDKVLLVLIILFVITALAAGGVWAWIFFGASSDENGNIAVDEVTPKTFTEVIPADAMLVAHYNVVTPQTRTAIADVWNEHVQEEATMLGALSGDPRLLLAQPNITQFNYVLIPGDPRYYLVLEGNEAIDQFLAQYSNVQVYEYAQWRVIHSFNTDLYKEHLALGTLPQGASAITSFDEPLTAYIAGDLLTQLYDRADALVAQASSMIIAATFGVQGNPDLVRFESKGATVSPAIGVADTGKLFAYIPADASFLRSGAEFTANIPDFTQPYVYYERLGEDGVKDVGVVTTIPENLRASVVLGDRSIEAALPKLLEVGDIGVTPGADLVFIESAYNEIPLRYVNVDVPLSALDYAIIGEELVATTSREGMFASIDAVSGTNNQESLTGSVFSRLEAVTSTLGRDRIFGSLGQPAIKKLFPGGSAANALQFGAAYQVGEGTSAVSGVIALPPTSTE